MSAPANVAIVRESQVEMFPDMALVLARPMAGDQRKARTVATRVTNRLHQHLLFAARANGRTLAAEIRERLLEAES
jgi:hypothetical protein